jgi:ATP-dependent protease ClpP protease subunit
MRQWFQIRALTEQPAPAQGREAVIDVVDDIGEDWWDGSGVTARGFVESVRALGDLTHITLNVGSRGGDFVDATIINAFLRQHPAKVTANVLGIAASAATLLTSAADEVVMPANAMLFVHAASTFAGGNADEMRKCAADMDAIDQSMVAIYLAKCGDKSTPEAMTALLKAESWLTAEQAVACGLCDRIADPMAAQASLGDQQAKMAEILATVRASLKAPEKPPASTVLPEVLALAQALGVEASIISAALDDAKYTLAAVPAPPAAIDPTAIIAACEEAKLPWLSVGAIKAGLSIDLLQARIGRVKEGRDLLISARVEPTQALLDAVAAADISAVLRHTIDCARPEEAGISGQHRAGAAADPGVKTPNHATIYAQYRPH